MPFPNLETSQSLVGQLRLARPRCTVMPACPCVPSFPAAHCLPAPARSAFVCLRPACLLRFRFAPPSCICPLLQLAPPSCVCPLLAQAVPPLVSRLARSSVCGLGALRPLRLLASSASQCALLAPAHCLAAPARSALVCLLPAVRLAHAVPSHIGTGREWSVNPCLTDFLTPPHVPSQAQNLCF